jgi:hypothetical protein
LASSSIFAGLRVTIAMLELAAWFPASCTGVAFSEAYLIAGNEPPATLIAGTVLAPIAFLVGPLFALIAGRARPRWTIAALTLPIIALALIAAPPFP